MASQTLSIDGFALRLWKNTHGSVNPPRGYLWINHGLGEHCGRYAELAAFMNGFGWDVIGVDLPGHGLTKQLGQRVHLLGARELPPLLNGVVAKLSRHEAVGQGSYFARAPKILFSHSAGAMVAAVWLCSERPAVEGFEWKSAFLSAPPIKLKLPVPTWKRRAVELLFKVAPNFNLNNEISSKDLSIDLPNRIAYDKDPLVHGNASARFFFGLLEGAKFVMENARMIEVPVCLAVAKQDPIVDPEGVREFFEQINSHKKYLEFPLSLHEIFNDIEKKLVYDAFLKWCSQ